MKEECGVAGIILPDDRPASNAVAFKLYYALYALQHRGQESTGIMVHNGSCPLSIKGMGLVPDVYNKVPSGVWSVMQESGMSVTPQLAGQRLKTVSLLS